MQKLFSIIYFVATIAFLSIIASADEGQSRAPKMIRLIKPLTTMKNRGNTGNLNPAVPDAFALWTPKRTRAAVPIESSSDGPALTDQDDIHQLLTVPEDHWKREGAVQKAAGRFLNSFPKDASDHRTYLDNKVHHGLRHIMKRMESISDCMEGFTFNSCASCCGFKFSTRGDLITAVNDYDVSLYGQMKCWDVSSITDLSNLFSGVSLNEPIGCWDVSKVTDMSHMFEQSIIFDRDIGNWDVGSVTTMHKMFFSATAFNQDINNWDVSKVTDMSHMFEQSINFDQDIGNWDVGSVTTMHKLFLSATAFNQDINNWDVGKVTDMSWMFSGATNFSQAIGDWNVGSVTDMESMFEDATSFNQPIGNWDVSNVTDMGSMFEDATSFNQPIGNWDVVNITDMGFMFSNASSFNQDLCAWYNVLERNPSISEMCVNASVSEVFSSSGCTDPADPNLSTKSSFCQACTCSEGKKYSELG